MGGGTDSSIAQSNVQFHPETVMKLSQKIKPELSQGPDGYPPYLLKKILPAIADPLYAVSVFYVCW